MDAKSRANLVARGWTPLTVMAAWWNYTPRCAYGTRPCPGPRWAHKT